jgi:hypothetical protein
VDEKEAILGSAVDAASDFLLVRDASVATGPALKKLTIDELVDVPGLFGNVSAAELGYLDGVTSAIQTQLNAKLGTSATAADVNVAGTAIAAALGGKQATLVSGTNIKTINLESLLGSGNVAVATSSQGALADTSVQASQLSTNGGASKVAQFDANGDLRFSGSAPIGAAASIGGVFFQNLERVWFLQTGLADGASIWFNTNDYPGGGELQVATPHRIAIGMGVNGAFQIGTSLTQGLQYAYLQQRHPATAGIQEADSLPLYFRTGYWNGVNTEGLSGSIQAVADGTSGAAQLVFSSRATNPNDAGTDGTRSADLILTPSGAWETGKAPAWDVLNDQATVTQTCSIYKTIQTAKLTLSSASRTLDISGEVAGMRGVIYVKQSGAGSYLLTLPTNSAKASSFALSTDPGMTDRLCWEYDGSYFFWTIENGIEVPLDADVSVFIDAGRANISDATQKDALNNLVTSLKASDVAGTGTLWSKFSVLYPFVGGTATPHAKNLKSTSYDITWVNDAAGRHTANGVTGDVASSFYGNTGFAMNNLGQNSLTIYAYCKTATPTTATYLLGAVATGGTGRAIMLINGTAQLTVAANSASDVDGVGVSASYAKHHALIRTDSSNLFSFVNSTKRTQASASVAPISNNQFLFARNANGPASNYTNANLAFVAYGAGLTDDEYTAFRAIVDTFQTALGRANP